MPYSKIFPSSQNKFFQFQQNIFVCIVDIYCLRILSVMLLLKCLHFSLFSFHCHLMAIIEVSEWILLCAKIWKLNKQKTKKKVKKKHTEKILLVQNHFFQFFLGTKGKTQTNLINETKYFWMALQFCFSC